MHSLRDVVAVLEGLYPPHTAQSWDQVGLVSGDPDQVVQTVLVALDPTDEVLAEAVAIGADLIVTHHPLLLRGIHSAAADTPKGAALRTLISSGIGLYCAHTNADVSQHGVGFALAQACGLNETQPLTVAEGQELGRVGDLPAALSLREFATTLAGRLPATAAGMRISGPEQASVRRVAVLGGAGDGAFEQVYASGADVYVTADLRHHPAAEAREQARLSGGTPYLVDAGHFASEWVWVPVLAAQLRQELDRPAARLGIVTSSVCTDPWNFVVPTGQASL